MTAVVLDKSFLQGTKTERVRALAATHRLLMSDALVYEILTTTPLVRRSCFAKLPKGFESVEFVSHVGPLIKKEISTRLPSGRPSEHKEDMSLVLNEKLQSDEYEPAPDMRHAIENETARLRATVHEFLERSKVIPAFFPDLLMGSSATRKDAHARAEKTLVDRKTLISIISGIELPAGEPPLPPAELMGENWAIYRWVQVQLLFSLDVYVRYQGNIPDTLTPKLFERMEHDVLDAELFMLGTLEGAFATHENKLKRWWRLACPEGILHE